MCGAREQAARNGVRFFGMRRLYEERKACLFKGKITRKARKRSMRRKEREIWLNYQKTPVMPPMSEEYKDAYYSQLKISSPACRCKRKSAALHRSSAALTRTSRSIDGSTFTLKATSTRATHLLRASRATRRGSERECTRVTCSSLFFFFVWFIVFFMTALRSSKRGGCARGK